MADKQEKPRVVERKEIVVVLPHVRAPGWLQGFIDFIREQGVVGLAVGLTLGLGSKSVVDSLVANILNPVIGVLTGGESLSSRYICMKHVANACKSKLGYGQVLSDIISFIVIAAVVYFVVKGLKLDRLDKEKPKVP
jgi:large conductance mechanosensitive channel